MQKSSANIYVQKYLNGGQKKIIDDLSVFGGNPIFENKLHVGRPNIADRTKLLNMINNILDNKWLTNNGPYVQEFEKQISSIIGVKNCIAMCNGTIALEIAIRALELSGEVIVPSFTFIATAHALQWQQITPVFCDIRRDSHTIDASQVERMITPRTTGVIGVHLWGKPCEIDYLTEICRKQRIKLLFDASHAFGCSFNGQMIGNFGEAEIFSFHATKFLNTFEGGIIATNNDILARKIRLMKNFGFAGYDNVVYLGTNGKMCEISAAMGLTEIESMNEFIASNKNNYLSYKNQLSEIPGVEIVPYDTNEKTNYQYIAIEIDESLAGIKRNQLIEILHAENVIARRYFHPGCHKMEPYRSLFPHAGMLLPNTELISKRIIVLPNGMDIGKKEIAKICHIIRFVIDHGLECQMRINRRIQ
jgi:dTDP-4-amino-4,6-dideoxygalactose transaminase